MCADTFQLVWNIQWAWELSPAAYNSEASQPITNPLPWGYLLPPTDLIILIGMMWLFHIHLMTKWEKDYRHDHLYGSQIKQNFKKSLSIDKGVMNIVFQMLKRLKLALKNWQLIFLFSDSILVWLLFPDYTVVTIVCRKFVVKMSVAPYLHFLIQYSVLNVVKKKVVLLL